MKALIVDDSSTIRKIHNRALKELGFDDVLEVTNGKEALRKIEELNNAVDIVILDLNMPEMNGLETLKRIRATPHTAQIPVLMCTSTAEKKQVVELILAGAWDYLVKPFQTDDLKNKIKSILAKR